MYTPVHVHEGSRGVGLPVVDTTPANQIEEGRGEKYMYMYVS
jgi:hypothetical protein